MQVLPGKIQTIPWWSCLPLARSCVSETDTPCALQRRSRPRAEEGRMLSWWARSVMLQGRSSRSLEAKNPCYLSLSLPQKFTVLLICGFQGTPAGKLKDCRGLVKQLLSGVAWNNLTQDIKWLSGDPGCKCKAESSSNAVSNGWRIRRKGTGERRHACLCIQALCATWVV